MSSEAKRLLNRALQLSPRVRTDLAAMLIRSLDPGRDSGAAEAWEAELDRRLEEIESGRARWVSWGTLRRRVR